MYMNLYTLYNEYSNAHIHSSCKDSMRLACANAVLAVHCVVGSCDNMYVHTYIHTHTMIRMKLLDSLFQSAAVSTAPDSSSAADPVPSPANSVHPSPPPAGPSGWQHPPPHLLSSLAPTWSPTQRGPTAGLSPVIGYILHVCTCSVCMVQLP